MNKQLIEKINKFAGKIYGFDIVIVKRANNAEFRKGFVAGKEYMKEDIIKIINSEDE